MQINNLTSASFGTSSGAQGTSRSYSSQQQQSFKSLLADVQSGNMTAAQQDYASLTQAGAPPANSPLAQIGQALGSNNISAAQQVVSQMQSQATGSGTGTHAHHHHHHGTSNPNNSANGLSALLSNNSTTSITGATSTSGSQLNTTA